MQNNVKILTMNSNRFITSAMLVPLAIAASAQTGKTNQPISDKKAEFEAYKAKKQKEFSDYKAKKQREFDEYRRKKNEEFAAYVRKKWEAFNGQKPKPKPKVLVVSK